MNRNICDVTSDVPIHICTHSWDLSPLVPFVPKAITLSWFPLVLFYLSHIHSTTNTLSNKVWMRLTWQYHYYFIKTDTNITSFWWMMGRVPVTGAMTVDTAKTCHGKYWSSWIFYDVSGKICFTSTNLKSPYSIKYYYAFNLLYTLLQVLLLVCLEKKMVLNEWRMFTVTSHHNLSLSYAGTDKQ